MTFTSAAELHTLTKLFIARTLPKSDWTHAAHFAVGLCLLESKTRDAFADMPGLIRAYNEATGVPNNETEGYHETITIASLLAARAFRTRYSTHVPLHRVLAELMDSPFGKSTWLLEHWSKPRLFSPEARRDWVEPDLKPLSFEAIETVAPTSADQE